MVFNDETSNTTLKLSVMQYDLYWMALGVAEAIARYGILCK